MKSYTNLAQSKKLAEILPIESADMCWGIDDDTLTYSQYPYLIPYIKYTLKEFYLPCWSLEALLTYLREIDFFPEIDANEFMVTMNITYYDIEDKKQLVLTRSINVEAETFIDACYEIILKLKEKDLL